MAHYGPGVGIILANWEMETIEAKKIVLPSMTALKKYESIHKLKKAL